MKTIKQEDWEREAIGLFGKKGRKWKFICPKCGTVQSGQDFIDLGTLTQDTIFKVLGFSCIGRFTDDKGCDWSLGGLLRIHETEVALEGGGIRPIFEFAK